MKLLYKHQILTSEIYKQPMVFLGWDLEKDDKIWVVKVDKDGKAVIDWYFTTNIRYIRHASGGNEATGGNRIVFGRFVGKVMNPLYEEAPTQEIIEKFGNYIRELIEKYKQKEPEKQDNNQKTTVDNE